MKKSRAISLIITMVIILSQITFANASGFESLFGQLYGSSTSSMPKKANLPDEFSITFEYVEDGKYKSVLFEKDKNGNYHYACGDDEYLFSKEGNGYKIGIKTINGFVLKNNDKYSWDKVKQLTAQWWKFAEPVDEYGGIGTVTEEGTGSICGRKTTKYKEDLGLGYNISGFSMSMSEATYYEFEVETGICLASSIDENISFSGMNLGDGITSVFECISFKTKDIVLPKLI